MCDGGLRRSSAVAASILRFWDRHQDEISLIGVNPTKEPNVWVYRLMSNALGVPIDDIDLNQILAVCSGCEESAVVNKIIAEIKRES